MHSQASFRMTKEFFHELGNDFEMLERIKAVLHCTNPGEPLRSAMMPHDPQRQRHGYAAEPVPVPTADLTPDLTPDLTNEQGFELFGRWVRVSLSALDHIGVNGTPEGMVGSASVGAVHGKIGSIDARIDARDDTMVVAPARRRLAVVVVTVIPTLLALITWAGLHGEHEVLAPAISPISAMEREPPRAAMIPLVRLSYDTSVLEPDHGARLQQKWHEQLEPVLIHAGLRAHSMRVRVVAFDEDLHNYEVRLELGDADQSGNVPTLRCDACTEARLVAVVVESARDLVTRL